MKEILWRVNCGATILQTKEGLRIATCIHDPDRSLCLKCADICSKTGLMNIEKSKEYKIPKVIY